MLLFGIGCMFLGLAYLLVRPGQSNSVPAIFLPLGLLLVFPCLRAVYCDFRDRFFGSNHTREDADSDNLGLLMLVGLIAVGITVTPMAKNFTHEQNSFLYGIAGLCLLYGVYECAVGKGLVSSTAEISLSVMVCFGGSWFLHTSVSEPQDSPLINALYILWGAVVMLFGWLGMRRWLSDPSDKPTYPPVSALRLVVTALSVWGGAWLLVNYPRLVIYIVVIPVAMLVLFFLAILFAIEMADYVKAHRIIRPPQVMVGTSLLMSGGIVCLLIASMSWHELAPLYRWPLVLIGISSVLFQTFGGYFKPWARRERGYR